MQIVSILLVGVEAFMIYECYESIMKIISIRNQSPLIPLKPPIKPPPEGFPTYNIADSDTPACPTPSVKLLIDLNKNPPTNYTSYNLWDPAYRFDYTFRPVINAVTQMPTSWVVTIVNKEDNHVMCSSIREGYYAGGWVDYYYEEANNEHNNRMERKRKPLQTIIRHK